MRGEVKKQENPGRPAAKPIRGEAQFVAHRKGATLERLIDGKPVAGAKKATGK